MAVHIRVPEPCTEKWDAMRPVEGGRYCAKCAHDVPDLSQASDAALAQLARTGTLPTCARFRASQLDRALAAPPHDPVHALQLLVMGAMMVLPAAADAKRKERSPEPTPLIVPDATFELFTLGEVALLPPADTLLTSGAWRAITAEQVEAECPTVLGIVAPAPPPDPPTLLAPVEAGAVLDAAAPTVPERPERCPLPQRLVAVLFRRQGLRSWWWRSLFGAGTRS